MAIGNYTRDRDKLSGKEDRHKITRVIKQVKREENIKEAHKKAKEFDGIDGIQLLTGDFREVCKSIIFDYSFHIS